MNGIGVATKNEITLYSTFSHQLTTTSKISSINVKKTQNFKIEYPSRY